MIGRVYKISSKDKTYVGSTTKTLEERLRSHLYNYNNEKQNYCSSYEVLKDEHEIELLYEGEFETIRDLHKMEGDYIRNIECVNIIIVGRSRKESNYIYRNNNIEKSLEYGRKYREDNKDYLRRQEATPYTCICGLVCRRNNKPRHLRSKKHRDFLNFMNICVVLGRIDHLLQVC